MFHSFVTRFRYDEYDGQWHFQKPQKWMSMLELGTDKFLLLSVLLQTQNPVYILFITFCNNACVTSNTFPSHSVFLNFDATSNWKKKLTSWSIRNHVIKFVFYLLFAPIPVQNRTHIINFAFETNMHEQLLDTNIFSTSTKQNFGTWAPACISLLIPVKC